MVSTFHGLGVAATGLAAHRRAIEVAGHNVANANTPGYSRQRVDLVGISGGSSMIHTGNHVYGGGVDIAGQTRIVDTFLIQRANTERAAQGTADELRQTLSRLESAFNEPGESGLASQMEAYWDAWDSVAATPDDIAARTALLQRGVAIADSVQGLDRTFDQMTADTLQRADALTRDINAIAGQVAELNQAIVTAIDAGTAPNDLMDKRDELVRSLSTSIGVTTRVDERGRMDINVGGAALVSGTRANQVSLDTADPGNAVLRISNSTIALEVKGGKLDGLLRAANTVIPQQKDALATVATRLREVVNDQHTQNQDLNGNPGQDFFKIDATGAMVVNPDLLDDPALVGAALIGGGRFDGSGAIAMAELSGAADGPDGVYRKMIAGLGVQAQTANRRADLQDQLTRQVDRQRESVSGVSIDEEMGNLVAYQQAYQASARFMTAVDEMLDQLINGTGRVGR